ncbi:MAG: 50S ribosomal protein L4 [Alphaproteobacteria bacterium]
MKLDAISLAGKKAGSVELSEDVFGLEPRADILQRVVRWQLAKRQQGTHDVKNRSEIARTGAKWGNQKGGGRARHGSRRVGSIVGGGRSFGPTPRSHAHDLPKKIRKLGLKLALSAKAKDGSVTVLDAYEGDGKTASLRQALAPLGLENALIIDGPEVSADFARAVRNIPTVDVLPSQGANVYDILRRERLVLTKAGLEALEARLK